MGQILSHPISTSLPPTMSLTEDRTVQVGNGTLYTRLKTTLFSYSMRTLASLVVLNAVAFHFFSLPSINLSPLSIIGFQALTLILSYKLLNIFYTIPHQQETIVKAMEEVRQQVTEALDPPENSLPIPDNPEGKAEVTARSSVSRPFTQSSQSYSCAPYTVWAQNEKDKEECLVANYRLNDCKTFLRPVLNLYDLNLLNLPEDALKGCSHLEGLFLKNNNFTTLPKSLSKITRLSVLDLSFNQLAALPDKLGQLKWLSSLELSHNHLKKLPHSLFSLTFLDELKVNHNQLEALPSSLGQLKHLKTLDLSHNHLKKLPDSLSLLTSLNKLNIQHNQLKALPDTLSALPELNALDVSHNQLALLPESWSHLPKLIYIDIRGNFIQCLHRAFVYRQVFNYLQIKGGEELIHAFEPDAFSKVIAAWYSHFLSEKACLRQAVYWDQIGVEIEHEKAEDFMQLLARLPQLEDFQSELGRGALFQRMHMILTSMRQDTTLRQYCFLLASEGVESCSDRVLFTLNNIEIACLRSNIAEENIHACLTLAKGLFRLDRLHHFTLQEMAQRKEVEVDEIEIYLYYRYALHEVLALPAPVTHMHFQNIAGVSSAMLQQASDYVLEQEADFAIVADYMCTQKFWDDYLTEKYKDSLNALLAINQARLQALEDQALNDQRYKSESDKIYQAYHAEVLRKKKAWTVQFLAAYQEIEVELNALDIHTLSADAYQRQSQAIQQRYHHLGDTA
jgi:hypothetical protein